MESWTESEEIETFWFFRGLRFRRASDSAYDSDFRFSLGHKRSYDSDYGVKTNFYLINLCMQFTKQ